MLWCADKCLHVLVSETLLFLSHIKTYHWSVPIIFLVLIFFFMLSSQSAGFTGSQGEAGPPGKKSITFLAYRNITWAHSQSDGFLPEKIERRKDNANPASVVMKSEWYVLATWRQPRWILGWEKGAVQITNHMQVVIVISNSQRENRWSDQTTWI